MASTRVLPFAAPGALEVALRELKAGRLVVFPTDTVYGVGAPAFDERAVLSIYEAKGRSEEKAIPILLGDATDLEKVTASVPEMARILGARFWPGPLTLVVPKRPDLPSAVSALDTVGVRVPDHEFARLLLKACGPMAVTSANRSGQPSTTTADEVLQQLDGIVALIIDGGRTPGGIPSTVLDCTGSEPHVLRAGPITLHEIESALR